MCSGLTVSQSVGARSGGGPLPGRRSRHCLLLLHPRVPAVTPAEVRNVVFWVENTHSGATFARHDSEGAILCSRRFHAAEAAQGPTRDYGHERSGTITTDDRFDGVTHTEADGVRLLRMAG